jgi:hypothetical protein
MVNKMKTIEHEGKVYQIGAVYEFSDDCKSWFVDTLESFDLSGTILGKEEAWGFMRECQSPLGTIKKAPLKLEDGCWYMCADVRYGQQTARPCYFFDGFKTSSNSKLWSPSPPTMAPLYKMIKA